MLHTPSPNQASRRDMSLYVILADLGAVGSVAFNSLNSENKGFDVA